MNFIPALERYKFMWFFMFVGIVVLGPAGILIGLIGYVIDTAVEYFKVDKNQVNTQTNHQNFFNPNADKSGPRTKQHPSDTSLNSFQFMPKNHSRWLMGFIIVNSTYSIVVYILAIHQNEFAKIWIDFTGPLANYVAQWIPAVDQYSKNLAMYGRENEIGVVRHLYAAFLVYIFLQIPVCIYAFKGVSDHIFTKFYYSEQKNQKTLFWKTTLAILVLVIIPVMVGELMFTGQGSEKYMSSDQIDGVYLLLPIIGSSGVVYIVFCLFSLISGLLKALRA